MDRAWEMCSHLFIFISYFYLFYTFCVTQAEQKKVFFLSFPILMLMDNATSNILFCFGFGAGFFLLFLSSFYVLKKSEAHPLIHLLFSRFVSWIKFLTSINGDQRTTLKIILQTKQKKNFWFTWSNETIVARIPSAVVPLLLWMIMHWMIQWATEWWI